MKNSVVGLIFLSLLVFQACENASGETKAISEKDAVRPPKKKAVVPIPSMLINGKDTLVRVDSFNKKVFWDLKYASTDNFMHRVLYDTLKTVYLQRDVAQRIAKCQELLTSIDSNLHLLVYDGVRPLAVQWEMWRALDTIPVAQRVKFVSNPRNGSVHNYGAAVDLTICGANRKPLDMGAGYDDSRQIAYPSLEAQFLASGELTKKQLANRQLLRKIMRSQRFINIPSEWWHFNAFPRAVVKSRYGVVEFELVAN
ncbi:MAG: M15 family metallopeptidase [Fluviicola sp.]|nr:M15 family metallopeptidase [Fluviicola sp.]